MPPSAGAFLAYWPFEPDVLLGVELVAVLYLVGGAGRKKNHSSATTRWRSIAFWLGLATILLALQSPIEILARQLFWVHMVQHLLLMAVAAPLLALASPWTQIWRGLPLRWRRFVAKPVFLDPRLHALRWAYHWVSRPRVIWVLNVADLFLWHIPALYDLSLRNHLVHHVEHGLFLGLSLAFWAQVVDQVPFHARLGSLARATYVFTAMIASWVLAAVLSFATVPFYAYSLLAYRPGGISALTDQQLGGGMMWVPGAVPYSIAFIWLLFRWLEEEDARPRLIAAEMKVGDTNGG
ncbi:MAG TPA: cytochrome c oxidase assembly protein [Candidatus Acidoferrum sp.]|jgi:putative membrane protein|nr:cytochrome c oxidase assembly protein [Candidatus Acidoferrum sp.]